MVIERRNFQRVYDLTTVSCPDWDDERDPFRKQKQKSSCWITVRVASEYFANSGWQITTRLKRPALAAWREAAEQQQIIAVHVENWAIFGCMLICCRYSSVARRKAHCNAQRGTFAF